MTNEIQEYYSRMTKATLLLQSVLHQLDEVNDASLHKHNIKRFTKMFTNEVEKIVDVFSSDLPEETLNSYTSIVQQIDNLINQLQIQVKE